MWSRARWTTLFLRTLYFRLLGRASPDKLRWLSLQLGTVRRLLVMVVKILRRWRGRRLWLRSVRWARNGRVRGSRRITGDDGRFDLSIAYYGIPGWRGILGSAILHLPALGFILLNT